MGRGYGGVCSGFGTKVRIVSFDKEVQSDRVELRTLNSIRAFCLLGSGTTSSGGAPSQLTAAILANLMSSGNLQNHITSTLIPAYFSRYHTILAAITKHLFPLGVSIVNNCKDAQAVVGGYFVWISLPPEVHCDEVTARAKREENLIVAPGKLFGVRGDDEEVHGLKGKIRLCFAWEDERFLEEGVERLGRVIKEIQRDLS